jgi:hypothetical protein
MANIEKLEAVLDHIKMHPESHNQEVWAEKTECGTAYCMAGWAVALAGYEFCWRSDGTTSSVITERTATSTHCELIEEIATAVLGLDFRDADDLFHSLNTVDDLELMVKNLSNGEPIRDGVPMRIEKGL